MDTMWLVVLIACVTVVAPVAVNAVTAEVGDTVTLSCHTEPQRIGSKMTVEVLRGNKEVHLFRDGKDIFLYQMPAYHGRTSISHDDLPKGKCSLTLSDVTEADSGTYWCSVKIETKQECITRLNVLPRGKKTPPGDQHQDAVINPTEKPDGLHEGNTTSNGTNPTEEKGLSGAIGGGVVGGILVLLLIVFAVPKSRRFILEKLKCTTTQKDINKNVPEGVPFKSVPPVPPDSNV